MLKLSELGEVSFRMWKLGALDKMRLFDQFSTTVDNIQCTWSQWWFSLSVWDFGIAAIFFSMHIWNLIHDAPFHCHRNVTALSPENTGCHLTTKCHSGTLTQAPKEKSELKQLILMTTKCFSSIKMKMIYTSCRFLLLLWISILKRKINFLYVKNLRQCDTFRILHSKNLK